MWYHAVLLTPDELLHVRWYQEHQALFYGQLVLSDLCDHARRPMPNPLRFLALAEQHVDRALALRFAYEFPRLDVSTRSFTERVWREDD